MTDVMVGASGTVGARNTEELCANGEAPIALMARIANL
jgi:hypothetical protein